METHELGLQVILPQGLCWHSPIASEYAFVASLNWPDERSVFARSMIGRRPGGYKPEDSAHAPLARAKSTESASKRIVGLDVSAFPTRLCHRSQPHFI